VTAAATALNPDHNAHRERRPMGRRLSFPAATSHHEKAAGHFGPTAQ